MRDLRTIDHKQTIAPSISLDGNGRLYPKVRWEFITNQYRRAHRVGANTAAVVAKTGRSAGHRWNRRHVTLHQSYLPQTGVRLARGARPVNSDLWLAHMAARGGWSASVQRASDLGGRAARNVAEGQSAETVGDAPRPKRSKPEAGGLAWAAPDHATGDGAGVRMREGPLD